VVGSAIAAVEAVCLIEAGDYGLNAFWAIDEHAGSPPRNPRGQVHVGQRCDMIRVKMRQHDRGQPIHGQLSLGDSQG
jgi:hypothetical protein